MTEDGRIGKIAADEHDRVFGSNQVGKFVFEFTEVERAPQAAPHLPWEARGCDSSVGLLRRAGEPIGSFGGTMRGRVQERG